MQVYSVLKPIEGRLKKTPRRAALKRRIDQVSSSSTAPISSAAPQAARNEEHNNFDHDIEMFKNGCVNKARKYGQAWVKAMIAAQRLEGHLPPEA